MLFISKVWDALSLERAKQFNLNLNVHKIYLQQNEISNT